MQTVDEQNYRREEEENAACPSCGGAIQFNPATGMLTCPYCGYEEEIPAGENEQQIAQEIDFYAAENRSSFQWGAEKKVVICKTCAAESIYDALEVANTCPYCQSNHLMEVSAENALAPNGVAPFQVTKQQANDQFNKWIKGKWFAPNEAKRTARADAFNGLYLPYWTFDTQTSSRYSARYGRHRTVTDREGKTRTVTDWYNASGFYQEFIDDALVRATTRHDESILRSVEPFQTNHLNAFQQDYLTGYIAERYSIGLEDGWKIAQQQIRSHLEAQISMKVRMEHRADVVTGVQLSTSYANITYKYIMLPLWHSSFRYSGKTYEFMVNGQTGQVGGKYPISPIKVTIAIIALLLIIGLIYLFGGDVSY